MHCSPYSVFLICDFSQIKKDIFRLKKLYELISHGDANILIELWFGRWSQTVRSCTLFKKKKNREENTTYTFWDTSSNCSKGLTHEIVLAHGQGISELEY